MVLGNGVSAPLDTEDCGRNTPKTEEPNHSKPATAQRFQIRGPYLMCLPLLFARPGRRPMIRVATRGGWVLTGRHGPFQMFVFCAVPLLVFYCRLGLFESVCPRFLGLYDPWPALPWS